MTPYDYRTKLEEYETKYSMPSKVFYEKWGKGEIEETYEAFEWAFLYKEALRQRLI